MRLAKFPWIKYDCEKVPNELECTICSERMQITTPIRHSTISVIGERFARGHMHAKEK